MACYHLLCMFLRQQFQHVEFLFLIGSVHFFTFGRVFLAARCDSCIALGAFNILGLINSLYLVELQFLILETYTVTFWEHVSHSEKDYCDHNFRNIFHLSETYTVLAKKQFAVHCLSLKNN